MRVMVTAVRGRLCGVADDLVGHTADLSTLDHPLAGDDLCLHLDQPWVDPCGRPWFVIPMCDDIVVEDPPAHL